MRILVISDTHVPARADRLPGFLLDALQSNPDVILHAGDVTSPSVFEEIRQYGTVEAVAGNMDSPTVKAHLPADRVIDLGGLSVGMMHGQGLRDEPAREREALRRFDGVDVVVMGHTHRPSVVMKEGVVFMNPGSPTDPRGGSRPSFGWMRIDEDGCRFDLQVQS